MNAPVVFYHLWPVGRWKDVNASIFSEIVSSGLSLKMDKMYLCVNSDIAEEEIDLCGIDATKVEIVRIPDTQSEWPTIDLLYSKYVNTQSTPILYMHCKGARFGLDHPQSAAIGCWNEGMTYFNVTNWKKCVKLLESGKHSVGIRVERLPVAHYSGNFWWINSSSLRLLLNPKTQIQTITNRHGAEFWIGRLGVNYLHDVDVQRNHFGYGLVIPKSKYAIPTGERSICVYECDNSSLSWLGETDIDSTVYSNTDIKHSSVVLAYLQYIIDNYDNLSQLTYFLKSNAKVAIPNLNIILRNRYLKFTSLGVFKTTDNKDGSPNHPGLPIESVWSRCFTNTCPDSFTFIAGSCFVVTKSEILAHSKSFYQSIIDSVEDKDNPIDDYCFERLWESFFTLGVSQKLNVESQSSGELLTSSPKYVLIYDELFNKDTIFDQIVTSSAEFIVFINSIDKYESVKNDILSSIDGNISDRDYVDYISEDLKYCILRSSYVKNNVRKKKKIIEPLIDLLTQIML